MQLIPLAACVSLCVSLVQTMPTSRRLADSRSDKRDMKFKFDCQILHVISQKETERERESEREKFDGFRITTFCELCEKFVNGLNGL